MSPEYFRNFAQQCRELIRRARTDAAREQLRVWVEEFEALAEKLEAQEDCGIGKAGGGTPPDRWTPPRGRLT